MTVDQLIASTNVFPSVLLNISKFLLHLKYYDISAEQIRIFYRPCKIFVLLNRFRSIVSSCTALAVVTDVKWLAQNQDFMMIHVVQSVSIYYGL
jgi:hypothetical protein